MDRDTFQPICEGCADKALARDVLKGEVAALYRIKDAARSVVAWAKPIAHKGKYAPYVLLPADVLDALRAALEGTE
jgi:hypothetical protein